MVCPECRGTGWIALFTSKERCDCKSYSKKLLQQIVGDSRSLSRRLLQTVGTYPLQLMWWGAKNTPVTWPPAQTLEHPNPFYLQDQATIVAAYLPYLLRADQEDDYATFVWMPSPEVLAKLRELHREYDLGFRDPILEVRGSSSDQSLRMGGVCPEHIPASVIWKAEGLRRYVTGSYDE